jgi:hypothetical protein
MRHGSLAAPGNASAASREESQAKLRQQTQEVPDALYRARQGALSVSPGVWLYQLSGDRFAVELTATGTKYYKDPDLN